MACKPGSYAGRLLQTITPAELAQARALYEQQLSIQAIQWEATTLYLAAKAI